MLAVLKYGCASPLKLEPLATVTAPFRPAIFLRNSRAGGNPATFLTPNRTDMRIDKPGGPLSV